MKSQANSTLPRAARKALVKLGGDIAVARKKRRFSTVSMAERAFLSRSTCGKIEKSEKSALPGAMRDSAPDRWGQQLIRRALRKSGEARGLSEIDCLPAVNDHTRIGALRYRRGLARRLGMTAGDVAVYATALAAD